MGDGMTPAFKNVGREIGSIARFAKHGAPALLSWGRGFGGRRDLISLNGRGYRNSNRVWEYRASNAYKAARGIRREQDGASKNMKMERAW